MRTASLAAVMILLMSPATGTAAQTAAAGSIDFDRDVKPILREKCTGCHGPAQQQAGLRLDARRQALMGSFENGVVIIPGNSARSRLVWRISGREYGPQMPPTGALHPDQIDTIKRWIDQGAIWPEHEGRAHAADGRVTALGGAF